MQAHPAAELFPMMGDAELGELSRDIKANGLLEAIAVFDGMILDGRNRLRACEMADVTPRFETLDHVESPTIYVVSKNYHRRHLTVSQRAAIGADMLPLLRDEAKQRQKAGGARGAEITNSRVAEISPQAARSDERKKTRTGDCRLIAANTVGVSDNTVQKAANVKKADPELFESVKRGEVPLQSAVRIMENREPKSKRQVVNDGAQKRRMVDGLSMIRGACRGISGLNVVAIRDVCNAEDIATWAKIANDCAKQLREFARSLSGGQATEIKVS